MAFSAEHSSVWVQYDATTTKWRWDIRAKGNPDVGVAKSHTDMGNKYGIKEKWVGYWEFDAGYENRHEWAEYDTFEECFTAMKPRVVEVFPLDGTEAFYIWDFMKTDAEKNKEKLRRLTNMNLAGITTVGIPTSIGGSGNLKLPFPYVDQKFKMN